MKLKLSELNKDLLNQLNSKSYKNIFRVNNIDSNASTSKINKSKTRPIDLKKQMIMLSGGARNSKTKNVYHKPSFSMCFDSTNSISRRKRSHKPSKKGSKERKPSFHKKSIHQRHDSKSSFSTSNKKNDDQVKIIMNLMKQNSHNFATTQKNDKIFKAIEAQIFSSRGSLSKNRDSLSPTSSKAEKNISTQRISAFKTTQPTNTTYYATLSPQSQKTIGKDRETLCSPMNMKEILYNSKKSYARQKYPGSKKRDSVGKSSSRHNDETIFATSGKPCFSYYNDKILKKKRTSCKKKKYTKDAFKNKTNDGNFGSATKHKPFKRMTTISTGDLLLAKKNSSFYHRAKDGSK